jgi:lipoyl(octanoyl) transferase
MQRPAYLLDLANSPMEYRTVLEMQRAAVAARCQGRLDRDLVILLEHAPVFTLGRRGGRDNLQVDENQLARLGIEVVPIERGGDVTYHGPGQLVAYIIINLSAARVKVVELVEGLENAMVRTAAHWGVAARGNPAYRGAWVADRKLGSVGITIRRGVSFHGLALNVNTDLTPFTWINPCGIRGCRMTSLAAETGRPVDMAATRRQMAGHLSKLFALDMESIHSDRLEKLIALAEFKESNPYENEKTRLAAAPSAQRP